MAAFETTNGGSVNEFWGLRSKQVVTVQKSTIGLRISPSEDPLGKVFSTCSLTTTKRLVLASTTSSDDLQNDITSFLFVLGTSDASVLTLQKEIAGTWTDQATLNTSTYGVHYPKGVMNDVLMTGYKLEWEQVITLHGTGLYRVKHVTSGGVSPSTTFSVEYCLKQWSVITSNDTIRFEYLISGSIGLAAPSGVTIDLGTLPLPSNKKHTIPALVVGDRRWYSQIRVQGICLKSDVVYESESIEFSNGEQQIYRDNARQEYDVTIGRVPMLLHDEIKTFVMMSDIMWITDYNSNNPSYGINQIPIMRDSGYSVSADVNTRYQKANLKFKDRFNSLNKSYC